MAFNDPYIKTVQGAKAANWDDQPPKAAPAASGKASLMQIYVPAEHTIIDYGSGETPGIRMATDTHVHLAARGPLTTISLGTPGGPGVGGPSGLNIVTDECKTELIGGKTRERYHGDASITYQNSLTVNQLSTKKETVTGEWTESCENQKNETIHGIWNQTCENAKTEHVKGTVTHDFDAEHNLTVGKPAVYRYGASKDEQTQGVYQLTVGGDSNQYVGGNFNQTVSGNTSIQYKGKLSSSVAGSNWGFHTDSHVTSTKGLTLALNETVSVSQNLVTASATAYAFSATGISTTRTKWTLWSNEAVALFK